MTRGLPTLARRPPARRGWRPGVPVHRLPDPAYQILDVPTLVRRGHRDCWCTNPNPDTQPGEVYRRRPAGQPGQLELPLDVPSWLL